MSGESSGNENGSITTQQLAEVVNLAVSQLAQDEGDGEPNSKRQKLDLPLNTRGDIDPDLSVKQILFNINKAICLRLDAIENKLENVNQRTKLLEDKVEKVVTQTGTALTSTPNSKGGRGAVIIGLPQSGQKQENNDGSMDPTSVVVSEQGGSEGTSPGQGQGIQNLGPNVTLITLNTEEDYPDGTWLGDETNPEMRVRVPISSCDLLHIHSNCRTAEKMALTLLDYLFDRNTQASSNLSGMGKHGKKQLNPLFIYGIRCHLIHKFAISEADWHRIKLNIDSKCRTAFRRKQRGQPLTVKAFHGKSPASMSLRSQLNSDDSMDGSLQIQADEMQHGVTMHSSQLGEVHLTQHGEVQILHATPEQIAQLRDAHQIQVLQGEQVLQVGNSREAQQILLQHLKQGDLQAVADVAVSMGEGAGMHVVTTETGEVLQITPSETDMQHTDVQVQDVPQPTDIQGDTSDDATVAVEPQE